MSADRYSPRRGEIGHSVRVPESSGPRDGEHGWWLASDGQWYPPMPTPGTRPSWFRPRVTWVSIAASLVWSVLVAAALVWTLDGISPSHPFDGLNNMLQIPFALPWFLIPIGVTSQRTDAWIAAGQGWLNAVLILVFLDGWIVRLRRHG